MEEQFITYETAVLAKEKGFDLPSNYFREQKEGNPDYDDSFENWNVYDGYFTIVTQSLIQKWLREKHNLFISITHRIQGNIDNFLVEYSYNGNNGQWNNIYYATYEEALENAIVECLQRISETVL